MQKISLLLLPKQKLKISVTKVFLLNEESRAPLRKKRGKGVAQQNITSNVENHCYIAKHYYKEESSRERKGFPRYYRCLHLSRNVGDTMQHCGGY